MIPFISVPDLKVGALTLHPFGILVATGVLVGTALTTRRARALGYDLQKLNSFVTWMLVAGFIGGHVLDELFYHWSEVKARPYSLLFLWEGLSSFGGFTGALIGIILWKFFELRQSLVFYYPALRKTPQPIMPLADLILSVFPIGWIFGRAGCSTVHDHLGARAAADALLAVSKPFREGDGTATTLGPGCNYEDADHVVREHHVQLLHGHEFRYDLGLLELMFTIIVALAFVITWRRKLPTGTYIVVAALAYAPVRFAMDFLRIPESEGGDTRYAGLTPAQYCCAALFLFGVFMLVRVLRLKKAGIEPADAVKAPAYRSTPAPDDASPAKAT